MSRKKLDKLIFLGLPQRIKEIRGKLTQVEFAEKIGVTQGQVTNYEKGINKPGYEILNRIAILGEVAVGWLLKGEETALATREHVPEIYQARPVELNVDVLTHIIAAARDYLRRHPQTLNDRNEAKLIADLYYYWLTEKLMPDQQVIHAYLPLAKRPS